MPSVSYGWDGQIIHILEKLVLVCHKDETIFSRTIIFAGSYSASVAGWRQTRKYPSPRSERMNRLLVPLSSFLRRR